MFLYQIMCSKTGVQSCRLNKQKKNKTYQTKLWKRTADQYHLVSMKFLSQNNPCNG